MNRLLSLILEGEKLSTRQLAEVLQLSEEAVEAELKRLSDSGILLGWRPVLNPEKMNGEQVRAVIEIKIRPERDGGFDRMALRIARFDEVESCYLMSGGYDLMAIVTGPTLHMVANFISQKLATMEGVLSTATHFLLRAYKEQGFELIAGEHHADKPSVSA
jgi:DNA-binding Lrp family transcriptional regulator